MNKTKTIIGLLIITNLIGAQGWHIYSIADLLSPYIDSPIAKTINAIYLSIGLSCGLFYFTIFDRENTKLLNRVTLFEISANNLCWIYTLFVARVFVEWNQDTMQWDMTYQNFVWHRAYYYDLIVSTIFGSAIPLFIRAYAPHIDVKGLFQKSNDKGSLKNNKSIIDEL